jgi:CubicO group peptidase (beta-lactamase class C family)
MRDLKILFGMQLLIILLLTGSQSFGQSNEELLNLRVDSLFSPWNNNYSPGCALGIIKDGTLIYEKDYGLANLGYNIPITPKSIFNLKQSNRGLHYYSLNKLLKTNTCWII